MDPGGGTYRGHEGVRLATTKWVGAWDEFRIDVLARLHESGRGKGSGVEVERQLFQLFTVRGNKIVRVRM